MCKDCEKAWEEYKKIEEPALKEYRKILEKCKDNNKFSEILRFYD